jgi:hypothetical protein
MIRRGMRVRTTYPDDRVHGHLGSVVKLRRSNEWYVRMDNHEGFESQDWCWVIPDRFLEPLVTNNKSVKHLLDIEY